MTYILYVIKMAFLIALVALECFVIDCQFRQFDSFVNRNFQKKRLVLIINQEGRGGGIDKNKSLYSQKEEGLWTKSTFCFILV